MLQSTSLESSDNFRVGASWIIIPVKQALVITAYGQAKVLLNANKGISVILAVTMPKACFDGAPHALPAFATDAKAMIPLALISY